MGVEAYLLHPDKTTDKVCGQAELELPWAAAF